LSIALSSRSRHAVNAHGYDTEVKRTMKITATRSAGLIGSPPRRTLAMQPPAEPISPVVQMFIENPVRPLFGQAGSLGHVDDQRDIEVQGLFHAAADVLLYCGALPFIDLEHQFVVNLQQHPAMVFPSLQ
jgi:hypothetical protein